MKLTESRWIGLFRQWEAGEWPSGLGLGNIILGLDNPTMEDGQEGTRLEAGRQAGVAAFCI